MVDIGDKFMEFHYSDRRMTSTQDYSIGEIKRFRIRFENTFAVIVFDKKNQLKKTTEININELEKLGDYWIRK